MGSSKERFEQNKDMEAVTSITSSADGSAISTNVDESSVDQILEMLSPLPVSRGEVYKALEDSKNDVSAAVEDLMGMATAREQELSENHDGSGESALDWDQLCTTLGLSPDDVFVQALGSLPQEHKNSLLAHDGAWIQQLLLQLDEAEKMDQENNVEEHPLAQLQALYPTYKLGVIERVLDQQNYDVDAAATALANVRANSNVQSYASAVSGSSRDGVTTYLHSSVGESDTPNAEFPGLQQVASPTRDGRHKVKKKNGHRPWQNQEPRVLVGQDVNADGVWRNSSAPLSLTNRLKVDRLHSLLPSIDRDTIQTTFYLNGCSSDATEAVLRETYNLPISDAAKSSFEVAEDLEEVENGVNGGFVIVDPMARKDSEYVQSRNRVEESRSALSDRYANVLRSFRSSNAFLAGDRVRELSQARRDLREAQRDAAHMFFEAQKEQLRRGQPVDLHGLIVLEALQVSKESIEFCKQERIRRCRLICGAGYHSKQGKARIAAALKVAFDRRGIPYRQDNSGMLTVFPLRSSP